MAINHRMFDSPQALANTLGAEIANRLTAAVNSRGSASMAVSGGSTPIVLFQTLSAMDIPWSQVVISLVDERWVDETHADSNAALVRSTLLQNYASTARLVTMKTNQPDAFAAQKKVSHLLANSILPLDIVLLGMGNDGHTASFFPHADGLSEALDLNDDAVCRAIRVAGMPYTRMTLTLRTLLSARYRVLQIHGQSKQQTLAKALQTGPINDMPVRAVLGSVLGTADGCTTTDTEIFYSP